MKRHSAVWFGLAAWTGVSLGCGDIKSGDDADAGLFDAAPGSDGAGEGPDATTNGAPVVNAGADEDVVVDATATLAGTASDPEGDTLSFQWTQRAGQTVTITAPTSLITDFTAAAPFGTSLVFELEACDATTCSTDTVAFYVVRRPVVSTYVAPPPLGDDTNGDGSRSAPWATVSQGVSAGAGMTGGPPVQVRVAAGDYTEAVTMVDDVSIVGGFDADWIRDIAASPTRLHATAAEGVLFEAGGGYVGTTELDGLVLDIDSGVGDAVQAVVTVQQGNGVLRNSAVTLPSASAQSLGLVVLPPASPASFTVEDTTFGGGTVGDTTGLISAIAVDGSAAAASITATRVAVDVPMPVQRTVFAVNVSDARLDLSDSTVVVQDVAGADTITSDIGVGVFGSGTTTMSIDNSMIDAGGGFATMAAVGTNGGGTLNITASTLIGGDVAGGADVALFSYGLGVFGGQAATVTSSTIVGGAVPPSTMPGLHTSDAVVATGDTVIDDCDIDAGPGDWGFGVWLIDATSAVIANTRVNQGAGGVGCTSADTCVGIFVQGFGGTLAPGQASPQAPDYSCCDPAHYGIVIEDSVVRGGEGHDSIALVVQDGAGPATACARGTVFDAGDCTPADSTSTCVGVAFTSGQRFALLNNVIYGGTAGGFSIGAQVLPDGTEPVVSNNYIHGGDPPISGVTTLGLFMGDGRSTGSGLRVLNNIVDAGTGDTRVAALEGGNDADPGRFMNNDLVVLGLPSGAPPAGAAFYRNCTPLSCGLLTDIADVNTQLTTGGQSTFGQGGCITDAGCLVDATPRGGDYTHAAGSACVDAGIERNASCNICQTPWTDMAGNHRLSTGYDGSTCSATGVTLSGDDVPDLGPMEQ